MFSSNRNSGFFMKTSKKFLHSPKTEISVHFIKISLFVIFILILIFLFVISENKNLSKLYKRTKLI